LALDLRFIASRIRLNSGSLCFGPFDMADTVSPMKNIRIDSGGLPRCWNCGSKGFTEKRTLRSKALVGVGALLTKKKMKCQRCGEYNDTGNGQPYDGPAGRKFRKEWAAEQALSA